METEQRTGHVYLIHATGTNRYKIGMTRQGRMAKRFEELNSSQAAFPLEIVRVIDVEDRFEAEGELHQKFKQSRKHGEWFELDRGDLRRVEGAMKSYGSISQPVEKWRLLCLIAGIIILLFAWQSYQGDRAQPSTNYQEQGE